MRMNIGENARMALTTLRENKMRSFLTVLGVVIGITALLSVVSVLVGVYGDVNAYLSDYGSETLFIFRFDPGIHAGRQRSGMTWELMDRFSAEWLPEPKILHPHPNLRFDAKYLR